MKISARLLRFAKTKCQQYRQPKAKQLCDDKARQSLADVDRRWLAVLDQDAHDEVALGQLAANALTTKDIAAAVRLIARLEQSPQLTRFDRLFELKARLATVSNESVAALACWQEAVAHGFDPARATSNIAHHFLSQGDLAQARSSLCSMGTDLTDSELGRIVQVKCYIQERRWTDAIRLLQDLDFFVEHRKMASDLLYRCYMNDFRHDSAAVLCDSLDPEVHKDKEYMLGKIEFRQHRFNQALTHFDNAINALDHTDSKVWLGRTLYAISEHESAVAKAELLEATADTDPLTCGRCWQAAGIFSIAEQRYQQAAHTSRDPVAWHALTRFYFEDRRWGQAYATICAAASAGITTPAMQIMKSTCVAAFAATGTRIPRSTRGLAKFDFRSSESMVTGIVNRIVAKQRNGNAVPQIGQGKEKKIALVINSLGPGGAERQVVNLANGLLSERAEADSGDEVHLLCTYLSRLDQDCFYLPQVDEQVSVSEYYDRNNHLSAADIPELADYADLIEHIQPATRQQLILNLAQRLIELQPTAVHGWLDETFINTALVCAMLDIKIIVGRWGSMPPGVNRTVTERDQRNIDYLQHAYREIARIPRLRYSSNSRLTGDAYAKLMGITPADVHIVYNGIDENKLERDAADSEDLRETLGIPTDAKVIGTVFRISEEKRPMLWIDVASQLNDLEPDMHFVIVGAGPLECQLAEYVRSTGVQHVHLVGKQSNVGAWLAMFDVLLLTSRVEGVSNAVVEAQFSRCPVVAPNVGGLSEAMQHGITGFLLDDHSPKSFASAIRDVVKSADNYNRMCADAQTFARAKFSVPTMVRAYRQLFSLDPSELAAPIAEQTAFLDTGT